MEKEKKELVAIEDQAVNPGALLRMAIDKMQPGEGAEAFVSVVERLADLTVKMDKIQAEKDFNSGLADFQQECPAIPKNGKVDYVSKKGGRVFYTYSPLDKIMSIVRPLLAPRGFSISWDTETIRKDGKSHIQAKATLLHRNGHRIESRFMLPIPDEIGNMTEDKRHAAVKAESIRGALTNILGLVTTDEDTNAEPVSEKLAPEQVEAVQKAMNDAMPKESQKGMLKYLKVEKVEDIQQSHLDTVMKLIARKKKQLEATDADN